MGYRTYITKAIVCGSKDSYTSDRYYLLFTEDAGMLWASARSVRLEKSKQRYALVDFSIIRVSLVRGKGGWRIGSVEAICNPFLQVELREARGSVAQVVKLLRRYLHGEEAPGLLYEDVEKTLLSIGLCKQSELASLDEIFTFRLLNQLGYVRPDPSLLSLTSAKDSIEALKLYDFSLSAKIKRATSEAAEVSHL